MVLVLSRTDDTQPGARLYEAMTRLQSQVKVTRLPLSLLGGADVSQLVDRVTAGRLPQTLMQQLVKQSEGSPFLIRWLSQHLLTLSADAQASQLAQARDVTELMLTLMAALSPAAQRVLSVAATAGSEVSRPVLRQVSQLEEAALTEALSELTAARFIETVIFRRLCCPKVNAS